VETEGRGGKEGEEGRKGKGGRDTDWPDLQFSLWDANGFKLLISFFKILFIKYRDTVSILSM